MSGKKVAFQGERGAYSEVAARELLGKKIVPVPCDNFDSLFLNVEKRKADFGIVPIENSLVGSIHKNYDLLLEHELKVIDEIQLRVSHYLIAPPKVSFKNISKVYSHPMALDQCRNFFKKHKTIAPISYYDTAGAVKMLSQSGLKNSAALASPYAAEIYKMKLVRKAIEDEKTNYTRFLLLGRKAAAFKGKAKTSIVFSLKNQPGVLFKALSVFALRDIDLTKIESRPSRKKAWQYYFYADFVGHIKEERVNHALDHLAEITHFIKVLGSYPCRVDGV
jgi:prephenate dehydratase